MADIFEISGRIHSTSQEEVVTTSSEIIDEEQNNKKQSEINADVQSELNAHDEAINAPSTGLEARVETLEEQVAFSGDFQTANTPADIVSGSGKITTANAVAAIAEQLKAEVGYYPCTTAAGKAAKVIPASDAPNYVLTVGGSVKVKMTNKNTAANPTLKIGNAEAKPLYYGASRASSSNTWEAGEVIEVYYDGDNFMANNVEGGGGDGVFDISAYNASGEPLAPAVYDNLTAALGDNGADVPASKRKGGMSVRFILQLYTVAKTTSQTQPTGTLLTTDPAIAAGTKYKASDLSAFATLPTTDFVVYYASDGAATPTYTIYTISKNAVAACEYVQYRYMSTDATSNSTFVNIANWQGVDDVPTAGSGNLVTSGGVEKELALGAVYDVSAKNPEGGENSDGKFTLEYILANYDILIPLAYRKGGMSIKFIQSSDNKYVQYILTKNQWSSSNRNWEKINLEDEVNKLAQDSSFLLNSTSIFGEGDIATFGPIQSSSGVEYKNLFIKDIPAGKVIAFKFSYNPATTTRFMIFYNGENSNRLIDTTKSNISIAELNNQWIIPNTGVTENISSIGIFLVGAVGDSINVSYAILKEPIIKDGILAINKFYLSDPYSSQQGQILDVPNTLSGVISYIPPIFQRAGLQVKFINADGVYKHYILISNVWSSNVNDWKELAYVKTSEVNIISKNVLQLEPISEEFDNGVSFAVGKRFSIVNGQVVLTDDSEWTVRKYIVPKRVVIQYRGTAPKDTADIISVFDSSNALVKRWQGMKLYPTSSAETLPLENDRDFFSGLPSSSFDTYILLNTKSGRDFFVNKFVKKDLIGESTEKSYDADSINKVTAGNNILKPLVTTYQGAYSADSTSNVVGTPNQNDPVSSVFPYCIFRIDVRKFAGKRLFLESESITHGVEMRYIYALDSNGNETYHAGKVPYYDVQKGDVVVLITKVISELNLRNYNNFQPLMIAEGDFANQIGIMVGETTQEFVPFTRYSEVFLLPENYDLIDDKQIVSKKNLYDTIGIYPNSVSILNSDRIAFIGDSYTESSFTPEGKAYVSKLSLFSDYAFMNMAISGDIYTGQLNKIRTHTEPYGVNFLKYVPKFTMLCCFANDIKYMNFQSYLGCVENAIRFIRAVGSEPVVCTEYRISDYYLTGTQGLEALAKRYKCKFINIANAVSTIRGSDYAPFWGGSHPGVRSNAIESDNYEKLLEEFERPDRSIKVFRLRSGVSYSELDNLTFNNNYERAKLFKEINIGHRALTNPAFVDNCTTAATSSIADEYRKIGDGENISLTKVSLISFVLPLTSTTIGDSLLKLGGTFSGKLYLRDVSASPYPNITIYQRFDIVSGQTVPSINDVYSGTLGGTTQNFTVNSIIYGAGEGGSDIVLCSPRATGYSDNSGGTLMKVSGSGPTSLEYSYTSPGYEEGVPDDTCGHWVEILDGVVPENGLQISQSVIKKAMKYDRLDVLLINSGNAFNVNNIELLFKGQIGKTKIGIREERKIILPNYYNTETELVPHPVFGEAGVLDTNWNVIPTKVYEDIQANKKTYPIGCISKVNVDTENSIETSVTIYPGKYNLEIDARYFPPIYTDGSGEQITVDSFDYALLKVELRDGEATEANANKTQSVMFEKVNMHWKLCQFELTYYISGKIKIIISSGDKEIEIAKVSMKKVSA